MVMQRLVQPALEMRSAGFWRKRAGLMRTIVMLANARKGRVRA